MKDKRCIIIMLVMALLLCGCTSTQQDAQAPTSVTIQPVATPQVQAQEKTMDAFSKLFPTEGNIPDKEMFLELSNQLSANVKGRLSEVTYTWQKNKVTMETLTGVRDMHIAPKATHEPNIQLMYDSSEYYNYILYLPDGYDPSDTEKKWPVIYFFHGIGERGSDLNCILDYGIFKYLRNGGKLDAIVIAPQCPGNSHWADSDDEVVKLVPFVDEMAQSYAIDTDRVYLTGLSMGGRCTWKLALAAPEKFAAIAVVCGRTNTYDFSEIQDMPLWIFHGAADDVVSFTNVNKIVGQLTEQKHEYFKVTVYPYLDHDTWTPTYARADVFAWLLSHSLKDRTID